MAAASVPVLIEEEAARRAARLQIQRELESMIAWVCDNVPKLRGVRVEGLREMPPRSDRLVIWAYQDWYEKRSLDEFPESSFIAWKLNTFPFLVGYQVSMWCTPEPMPQ